MLLLSSLLGIIIGDNTWLLALQLIGAKRVIVIDTLKPFLAAILAYYYLSEPFTLAIGMGLMISTIGIILVSFDRNSEESSDNNNNISSVGCLHTWGYILAAINVILDAFGSLLTKIYGQSFNTYEINLLRFGFASISLAIISFAIFVSVSIHKLVTYSRTVPINPVANPLSSSSSSVREFLPLEIDDVPHEDEAPPPLPNRYMQTASAPWYLLPGPHEMAAKDWGTVIGGILLVTFLCPALSNYALFQIPLGLCLTLSSLGPVYAVPLVYLLSGEKTGTAGIVGALLAFAGVSILCATA